MEGKEMKIVVSVMGGCVAHVFVDQSQPGEVECYLFDYDEKERAECDELVEDQRPLRRFPITKVIDSEIDLEKQLVTFRLDLSDEQDHVV